MKDSVTPIRAQYLNIKKQHPDAIVLFRLGDFYETFDEDARIAARVLDIVLTSRGMGKNIQVPMAGIPYHALDDYLGKLIKQGYRVAICEQLTKPGEMRGLVSRDVVRVVTPGTVVEPSLLETKSNNYLVSIAVRGEQAGLAYIDITTSEFACTQLSLSRLRTEIDRLAPAEIIAGSGSGLSDLLHPYRITEIEPRWFAYDSAERALLEHFKTATLEGFGCAQWPQAIEAAGGILHYLETTQKQALEQASRFSAYSTDGFLSMDSVSYANLEVFKGLASGDIRGSLLSVLDETRTPMGARLLRRWLTQPLLNLDGIRRRQNCITWLVEHAMVRHEILAALKSIADLGRIMNRIRNMTALPREIITLKHSLAVVPGLVSHLTSAEDWPGTTPAPMPDIISLITMAIDDQPAAAPGDGDVIKRGFSGELDALRSDAHDARQYLASMEKREREKTGIKSLKIGFTNVFGYYIEVSHANHAQVPDDYIRKQTLAGAERYYTPELKEYETRILNAREKREVLEAELFRQICRQISLSSEAILELGDTLAELDIFSSLADIAVRYGYICPELDDSAIIDIRGGRHPVIERTLLQGEYIPNSLCLSNKDARIIILTGPNMAGKSTYLKQSALIVIMAQIGSYVPADKAVIGLVDRIFTRIGAREDLSSGKSTFMVEMVETAAILNGATPRSLLILDEVGRGTSTYDGMAIAQAVVEFIHNSPALGAKTLFATHYHELTAMAESLPHVRNFNVAIAENNGEVVFLHKIVHGGAAKSYGIHVARIAGLPKQVIERARNILSELEGGNTGTTKNPTTMPQPAPQLSFFASHNKVVNELKNLAVDAISPLEALTKLYELKKKAEDDG